MSHKSEGSVERHTAAEVHPADSASVLEAGHAGVKTVEATQRVWDDFGKWARYTLFGSLALAAYVYSLDGTTTWNYLSFATSHFEKHALIASIQTAQSIIVAVGKPVIAKIADVRSRGFAFVVIVVFYVVGYIVIASAQNAPTVGGGIIISAVGYTGLQLLAQIIIGDLTNLRWRGLVSSLMSLPFIINAFVGTNIAASILAKSGWRWGYGMFAILIPAALAPLILTLLWGEWKAKKMGYLKPVPSTKSFAQKVYSFVSALNVVGLLLLGASVALILLPLTLYESAKGRFKNPSMIAMEVVGCVLFVVFVAWEWKFAKFPVIPPRFLKNRTFVIAALVGAFDFISFYISWAYLYSFVLIVKPWSLKNASYFSQTQTVALTVFAITAGFFMLFVRRAKPLLIFGLTTRLVGAGLMIHSRGANASDAEVVWSQLLQGIGGGFAAISSQTLAQAAVKHDDLATITAAVLLCAEIGGAIGSAIAGSIWTSLMPGKIAQYLPFLDQATREQLYGSIVVVMLRPRDDPVRVGVISAYDDVMKIMCIAATVFAIPPLVLSLFIPNWRLGDSQNAIETGEEDHSSDSSVSASHDEKKEKATPVPPVAA